MSQRHHRSNTHLALGPLYQSHGHAMEASGMGELFLGQSYATAKLAHSAPEVGEPFLARVAIHVEHDACSGYGSDRQRMRFFSVLLSLSALAPHEGCPDGDTTARSAAQP
jgi:hypothetical protein